MRQRIIQEATVRIGKYGFRHLIMDDLAAALGMSKKTLYKYFSGKQDLITSVVDSALEKERRYTLQALESRETWLEKLDAVLFIQISSEYSGTPWVLAELKQAFPEEWHKVEEIRIFKRGLIRALLDEGLKKGEVNSGINLDVVTAVLYKAVDNLFDYHTASKLNLFPDQLLEQVKEILLYGILKRSRGRKENEVDG